MPDTYDSVPYTSYCYPYTHPDLLCALGRLFGLSPATPARARVLELGCASGGNLLPMAELLPDAEFVGIDRSRVQVDRGRALAGELGLRNLELVHADILTVDPRALGTFDYVISHGVFAWVARPVQDRLLQLVAAVLRPHALAFVSYNVYPGWHMREMVRRMMLFHLRRFTSADKRLEQARALVEFMAGTVAQRSGSDDPYAQMLGRELDTIRNMSDAYLFHEHLERDNSPLYFHEFIDRLRAVPLRYLCDTDLNLMVTHDLPTEVQDTLARVATDQVSMEQYLDFVRNRQFRTSVLCRAEQVPQRKLQPERVESLRLAMRAEPRDVAAPLEPGVELGYACASGARISSGHALTKAALLELCERWPASVPFEQLFAAARERVRAAGFAEQGERINLATDMIECLLRKAVVARIDEPPLAVDTATVPTISPTARLLVAREGWLPTLHHAHISVQPAQQRLVELLDGSRDRTALLVALTGLVTTGELSLQDADGQPITEGPTLEAALARFLDDQLDWLRRLPALVVTPPT